MNREILLKNRVREYRLRAGLSQTQLGDLIGISKNSVSSIEVYQFEPTAYNAALLCRFFGCRFVDLFYFEDSE